MRNYRHHCESSSLQDCTEQLVVHNCYATALGDVPREPEDRKEWIEQQGWKRLSKYIKGFRLRICSVCGKITLTK